MNTIGIIAEYNPFHQGHVHHIQQTRKLYPDALLVAVISGWFCQRGLPSLMPPEKKAELAVRHGIDIVIELPAPYACQSADWFAKYAMQALSVFDVDLVIFGSESGNLAQLEEFASLPPAADPATSQARANAFVPPNDMLGIQYIRAGRELGIPCACILRDGSFLSATESLRRFLAGESGFEFSSLSSKQTWDSYWPYLRYMLLMTDPATLANFHLVTEGIENRLKKAAASASCWQAFLEQSISKTYTRARIQRTVLMILLQMEKAWYADHPAFFYGIVLDSSPRGKAWLKADPSPSIFLRGRDLPDWLKTVRHKTRTLWELGESS